MAVSTDNVRQAVNCTSPFYSIWARFHKYSKINTRSQILNTRGLLSDIGLGNHGIRNKSGEFMGPFQAYRYSDRIECDRLLAILRIPIVVYLSYARILYPTRINTRRRISRFFRKLLSIIQTGCNITQHNFISTNSSTRYSLLLACEAFANSSIPFVQLPSYRNSNFSFQFNF